MERIRFLIENVDQKYSIEKEDITEYAKQIGIDVKDEKHLMWIAEEGLAARVPEPWMIFCDDKDRIFYYNKRTGEKSWLHPLDKEYSELVVEERTKSKSLNSTSSDCGFESKLSSLADAPPLSSSEKNTPPFKYTKTENINKKIDTGRFENRRGGQLAPVRLNALKMPVPTTQKSGTGVSFMPKGSSLSRNIKRIKEPELNETFVIGSVNRAISPQDEINESENSDDGSKYSYEETDEEEKDVHAVDHYDLLDTSQLSPIHSADESPEALDINSLVQLGTKIPPRLDAPMNKMIPESSYRESSPSLSLRKIGP